MTSRLPHCLECDRKVVARQLCSKHYIAAKRRGELPSKEYKKDCEICGAETVARDLCPAHYQQFRRKVMGKGNRVSAGPCTETEYHHWSVRGTCLVCGVDRPEGWT